MTRYGSAAAVTVNLAALAASGFNSITSIENAIGGDGNDSLTGNVGANTLNGGVGADTMAGGGSTDTYVVDNVGDVVTEAADTATDVVQTSLLTYTLADNVENLVVFNGSVGSRNWTGNAGNNTITSGTGADTLNGGAGNDILNGAGGTDTAVFTGAVADYNFTLSGANAVVNDGVALRDGNDTLMGVELVQFGAQVLELNVGTNGNNNINAGAGNDLALGFNGVDTLTGGAGIDVLVGGAGNDVFDFNAATESGVGLGLRDIVTDYAAGDIIDLTTIDANAGVGGNQNFVNLAGGAFTAAGQVRYEAIDTNGDLVADATLIQGNTAGVGTAEFEILLQNYTGVVGFNL